MSKKETPAQGTYDSWFKIGNEHYEKGEYEEALMCKGTILERLERFQEARTCFEKLDKITSEKNI